jgi:hypothetical protein
MTWLKTKLDRRKIKMGSAATRGHLASRDKYQLNFQWTYIALQGEKTSTVITARKKEIRKQTLT